jgi:single-strand selective monofunctional uracil DNA glycosylase
MPTANPAESLVAAADTLRDALRPLQFSAPVTHVYDPLDYAWAPHTAYLRKFGNSRKKGLFLGMNPGPYGMAQTGVPFGEIPAVRDWMGIEAPVQRAPNEHPKRPVEGFACRRSEVSGRRLWGWAAAEFGTAERFFSEFFVVNYCPLIFLEQTGRNRTPDKIPSSEMAPAEALCDEHLIRVIEVLQPEWLIGVGGFAENRLKLVAGSRPGVKITRILHPSPASPAANRDWAGAVDRSLREAGVI